jgi:hypothetical protein
MVSTRDLLPECPLTSTIYGAETLRAEGCESSNPSVISSFNRCVVNAAMMSGVPWALDSPRAMLGERSRGVAFSLGVGSREAARRPPVSPCSVSKRVTRSQGLKGGMAASRANPGPSLALSGWPPGHSLARWPGVQDSKWRCKRHALFRRFRVFDSSFSCGPGCIERVGKHRIWYGSGIRYVFAPQKPNGYLQLSAA